MSHKIHKEKSRPRKGEKPHGSCRTLVWKTSLPKLHSELGTLLALSATQMVSESNALALCGLMGLKNNNASNSLARNCLMNNTKTACIVNPSVK